MVQYMRRLGIESQGRVDAVHSTGAHAEIVALARIGGFPRKHLKRFVGFAERGFTQEIEIPSAARPPTPWTLPPIIHGFDIRR